MRRVFATPTSGILVIPAHGKPNSNCGRPSETRLAMLTTLSRWAFLVPFVVSFSLMVRTQVFGAPLVDSLTWISIAGGVHYAVADSALGEGVFIGLGGWTATQEMVDGWVTALYAAKLRTLGIRHLYSVMGPKDNYYDSREIGTLDVARHLVRLMQQSPASDRIIVAGHSSGAYVAHVLFRDLYDGAGIDSSHLTDGKILYFVLDEPLGAEPSGVKLTDASADRLGHIYGVYAFIPARNLYSYAPSAMIALGNRYGSRSSSVVIDASGSGCQATLCLHMALINQKPYNPNSYDWRDYGAINADHPVQTAYLDAITAVDLGSLPPKGFRLWENYPNPFNPRTAIKYGLPTSSEVKLSVFDILGREVLVLVNERRDAGVHEVKFDASGLASGVYLYRLQAGEFVQTNILPPSELRQSVT